jgi:lipopolysaccharide transport system ATP-binding protein
VAAIAVRDLGKRFEMGSAPAKGALYDKVGGLVARNGRSTPADDEWVWALRHVDFEVRRGEIFGVIGRNGSGKTTLLSILGKVTAPTEGSAEIRGRVATLLAVGAGFHPQLTGRDNIALNAAILGMSPAEMADRLDPIVEFSGIGRFIDSPVKHYSSGMYSRLAYSVAAFLPAEIMLLDEVLSVGDAEFQAKSYAHMIGALQDGRSVVYVGHGMTTVRELCTRAVVLDAGSVVFYGPANEAVDYYEREVVGQPVRKARNDGSDA